MVRGRPMNTALPETRELIQQRKFRAKKAEKVAELEATNRALVEENRALKTENQLLRDHLLNPDAVPRPPPQPPTHPQFQSQLQSHPMYPQSHTHAQSSSSTVGMGIGRMDTHVGGVVETQMRVVQDVQRQLEEALLALKAISGSEQESNRSQVSPESMATSGTRSRSSMTPTTPINPIPTPMNMNYGYTPSDPSGSSQHPFALHNHVAPTQVQHQPRLPEPPINGKGKCCGGATTCAPPPQEQEGRMTSIPPPQQAESSSMSTGTKRTRYESPYSTEVPRYPSPAPAPVHGGEMPSTRIADWRASYQHNAPPLQIREQDQETEKETPGQNMPINGEDCCLGVVKCNERGEIVG